MSAFILATFCISMALAALGVESLFQAAKLVPSERHAQIVEAFNLAELHSYSEYCFFWRWRVCW
jgi:hypothetical protein